MSENKFITLDGLKTYNNKIQEQIEAKNTEQDAVIATKFDKAGGAVTGSLTLPNSPTTPDEWTKTQAYTSRVTANGEQTVVDGSTTLVTEIKGSTVSCKNLIPYPYDCGSSGSQDGIDYTVNADGSITLNGAVTTGYSVIWLRYDMNPIELEVGKTYRINSTNIDGVQFVVQANDYSSNIQVEGTVATYPKYMVYIAIYSSATLNNATIYPMLYEGTEEKPYQPYFTGLKNAYFEKVVSTGRNLIDFITPFAAQNSLRKPFSFAEGTYTLQVICDDYDGQKNNVVAVEFLDENYNRVLPLNNGSNNGINSWSTFSITAEEAARTRYINVYMNIETGADLIGKEIKLMLNHGATALPYEPYTEDTYQLPQTLELGEWDSYNPQTGKLVRATKEIVITGEEPRWSLNDAGTNSERFGHGGLSSGAVGGSYRISNKDVFGVTQINVYSSGWVDIYDTRYKSVEEWTNYLKSLNAAGTPLRIAYKLATPTTETIENAPKSYTVYNGGTETIVGNSNDVYGVLPTISQVYSIHENSTEAANKAYVNNGLAKKLDKSGGTITGNLIVEGKTDTALGAIVSKQNGIAYGLAYDGDAYKLGEGTINSESGEFTFNENEGLPIALRDDNSTFTDGNFVKWSEDGKKLIDSNISSIPSESGTMATREWVKQQIEWLIVK